MERDELLTVDEVAALVEANPVLVRRWIRQGRLPARKFGGSWAVRAGDAILFHRPTKRK